MAAARVIGRFVEIQKSAANGGRVSEGEGGNDIRLEIWGDCKNVGRVGGGIQGMARAPRLLPSVLCAVTAADLLPLTGKTPSPRPQRLDQSSAEAAD